MKASINTINMKLTAAESADRLHELRKLLESLPPDSGQSHGQSRGQSQSHKQQNEQEHEVNNHVHTSYSFSPYSPSLAALRARQAGLKVVGIVDHDTVAGADEMRQACELLEMHCTVGCEFRAHAGDTALSGRLLNMPNAPDLLYMVLHGIPSHRLSELSTFLKPIRRRRQERNRAQLQVLNDILATLDMPALNYEEHVLSISQFDAGGTVTERHILAALADRLLEKSRGRCQKKCQKKWQKRWQRRWKCQRKWQWRWKCQRKWK